MFGSALNWVADNQFFGLIITLFLGIFAAVSFRYCSQFIGDEDYSGLVWIMAIFVPIILVVAAGITGIMFVVTLLPH